MDNKLLVYSLRVGMMADKVNPAALVDAIEAVEGVRKVEVVNVHTRRIVAD